MPSKRLGTGKIIARGKPPLVYVFDEQFLTVTGAPLTSPRNSEPSGTQETLIQNDGQFSITASGLVVPTQASAAWGDLGGYLTAGIARVPGRAILAKFRVTTTSSGGTPLALLTAAALGATSVAGIAEGVFVTNTTRLAVLSNGSIPYTEANATTPGEDLTVAIILLATGAYYYFLGGAEFPRWKSAYTSASGSQATVYPGWTNFNMVHTIRRVWAVDFPNITTIASGNQALTEYFPN